MHLMSEGALLSSSLQYGIVARSIPLTGKVLRGFLDAGGMLNGLGNGNPNAEFSPNVAACALTSDGGTAKIAWGFTNGEVAMTTAASAMNHGSRAAAKYARCKVGELHDGVVDNVIWDTSVSSRPAIVTSASDGRVKLWDAREFKCLWSSEKQDSPTVAPFVKLASNVSLGLVAALSRSGEVHIWTGVASLMSQPNEVSVELPVNYARVSEPEVSRSKSSDSGSLFIDPVASGSRRLSVLLSRTGNPSFHRINLGPRLDQMEWIKFGDATTGSIRCIQPSFGESSFVIAGDELGYVRIFDWNSSLTTPVPASMQFEAHDDGPVTTLAWNPVVLATGSSRGAVKVWDSLSFQCLRVIASASPRGIAEPVSQIILEQDMIVATVGSRAVALKVDRVGREDKKGKKTKRGGGRAETAKWHKQLELYRDINESRQAQEQEQSYIRHTFGREREQRATLEGLGLSEIEAVEYILMLSRDEDEHRRFLGSASQSPLQLPVLEDEGVFEADFDDLPLASSSSRVDVPVRRSRPSSSSTSVNSRSWPRTPSSSSNHKIQVSPRFQPEPMEAGPSVTPLNIGGGSLPLPVRGPPITDEGHFPSISPSPSSAGTSIPSSIRRSVSGSPESRRNAWATPISRSLSSSGAASPVSSPRVVARQPGPSGLAADLARYGTSNGSVRSSPPLEELDEDEELRFAIELSLAEARSRGEDV